MRFVFIIFDLLLYRIRFRTILSLFMLMGVSWVMEIVSFWVGGSAYTWIPTDILNILTGVLVFIILICKPRVLNLLKGEIPFLKRTGSGLPSSSYSANHIISGGYKKQINFSHSDEKNNTILKI